VRLDPELRDQAAQRAADEGVTVSEILSTCSRRLSAKRLTAIEAPRLAARSDSRASDYRHPTPTLPHRG